MREGDKISGSRYLWSGRRLKFLRTFCFLFHIWTPTRMLLDVIRPLIVDRFPQAHDNDHPCEMFYMWEGYWEQVGNVLESFAG